MDPPEQPTEHDQSRIEQIDQARQADADPAPGLVQGMQGDGGARLRLGDELVDRGSAAGR